MGAERRLMRFLEAQLRKFPAIQQRWIVRQILAAPVRVQSLGTGSSVFHETAPVIDLSRKSGHEGRWSWTVPSDRIAARLPQ